MKTPIILLCIAILLAVPTAVLAQRSSGGDFYYGDGSVMIGQVISIDKRAKSLEIYDDSHHRLTVLADKATIYDKGKRCSFGDLDEDGLVRVYGRNNGRSAIDAYAIHWLGKEKDYRSGMDSTRVYGIIRSTDKGDGRIDLTVDRRTEKIQATNMTEITDRGRRIGFSELRKGDAIAVEGYRARNDEVVADSITVGGGYDYRTDGRRDSIQGRVTRETGVFDRKLRIETDGRDRRSDSTIEIDVAKDAQVIRRGRSISVHDINEGEVVYVEGSWSGSTFRATRVEVGESYGYWGGADRRRDSRNIGGPIRDIDYRRREMVIDWNGRRTKVYCDRAQVWDGGRERDFEDLRKGDDIRIEGSASDDNIDATRIDIGGSSGYWLDRGRR